MACQLALKCDLQLKIVTKEVVLRTNFFYIRINYCHNNWKHITCNYCEITDLRKEHTKVKTCRDLQLMKTTSNQKLTKRICFKNFFNREIYYPRNHQQHFSCALQNHRSQEKRHVGKPQKLAVPLAYQNVIKEIVLEFFIFIAVISKFTPP